MVFDIPTGERTFAARHTDDPRLLPLVGPGGPFETEETVIDGVPLRTFVQCPRSLVVVFRNGSAHHERECIVYDDDRLTFGDMRAQSLALANRLRTDMGVHEGDRVVIAMRNYPEFITAFWATIVLGAVAVPLNAWWQGQELQNAVAESAAKVVVADSDRVDRLLSVDRGLDAPVLVEVRGAGERAGVLRYEDVAFGRPLDEAAFADPDPNAVAAILYTSGTTGRPKGVATTHRALLHSVMNMSFMTMRGFVLSSHPVSMPTTQPAGIMVAPLFHVGGITAIVGGVLAGSKLVLTFRWDLEETIALIERENITGLGGVPTIARALLEHPELPRFAGRVMGFSMGAANVAPELPRLARQVLGESLLTLNGYGLTETTSAVVTNIGDEYAAHPDSVGLLNLTADLRVVGLDGVVVGVGELGELWFRSPQISSGYWRDAEATGESFVEGWFRSGDIGYIDEDGFVYVVDRLKDVIIRGGENVYCAEVEAVLFEHPDVLEAAVLGVPDHVLGEIVCAVVVPRPGAQPRLSELREFTRHRLAAFKCPEALYVTPDVPRTATEKIAKKLLKQQVLDNSSAVLRS